MTAKEWRRRINKAYEAKLEGELGPLDELCDEVAVLESALAATKTKPIVLPEMLHAIPVDRPSLPKGGSGTTTSDE